MRLFKKKIRVFRPSSEPHLGFKGISMADLEVIKKFGKPSNRLGGYICKSFVYLPYGIVRKELPLLQDKEDHLGYITLLLECQYGRVDLRGVKANDIMAFMLFIKKEQEKIYNIEKTYLSSAPDPLAIAAGINKLDEFGALATIHKLAGRDILKHEAVEALPYFKIYEILKLEKITSDIDRKYAELTRKQKN